MIIISLMGGLGNQMFQYAAARRLALLYDTPLRIDAANFRKMTLNKEHNYQLNEFCLTAPQATAEEVARYRRPRKKFQRIRDFIAKAVEGRPADRGADLVYEEPEGSAVKAEFLELGPDRYLVGYFNSYKYFHPIRELLLQEYQPKNALGPAAAEMIERIEDTNSVGLHIRRGDYVTDPNVRQCIAGIITDRYYKHAAQLLMDRVKRPHFFVFSNDMPWVADHFTIAADVTYVDINPPQRGFEDLWMMSRCKHNITAGGSTFSWWAAYLNCNPDKIVVRTEKISNDPRYDHREDYFPPEWETVSS